MMPVPLAVVRERNDPLLQIHLFPIVRILSLQLQKVSVNLMMLKSLGDCDVPPEHDGQLRRGQEFPGASSKLFGSHHWEFF